MPTRSQKRQKVSPSPPTVPSDKHTAFTHWALTRGVEITHVAPASLPGRGIGLVTTAAIKKNTRLIFVPERAMIAPWPSIITSLSLSSASPQAQLAATLTALYQSDDSAAYKACSAVWPTWHDFSSSLLWLPPAVSLEDQGRSILPFTLQKPLERVRGDFERDMGVWSPDDSGDEEIRQRHVYHWAIANTRSFHWKPPGRAKGCMVVCPVLDYMNHCASGKGVSVSCVLC